MSEFKCRVCGDPLLWSGDNRLVHQSTGKMTRGRSDGYIEDHVALPEKRGCFDTQEERTNDK